MRLALFSAVGGDPDQRRGRFGGLNERSYNEEAEKQGKTRGHLVKKGVVGTQTTPAGQPGKKAAQLIIGSA